MKYEIKRFSATRKAVKTLEREAKSLLSRGLKHNTPEGKEFLIRSAHLSNSYGKIASKGKVLNPGTWKQSTKAEKAQKDIGKVIDNFYKK